MPTPFGKFYTVREVAEILRKGMLPTYRLFREGGLNRHKVGGTYLINESDLKAFVDRCRLTEGVRTPGLSPAVKRSAIAREARKARILQSEGSM